MARQVCQRLQQACRFGLQKINLYPVNWSATTDKNMGLANDALFIWRRASQGKLLLPCPTQKDKSCWLNISEYIRHSNPSDPSILLAGLWTLGNLDIDAIVTCITAVPRALLATGTNEAYLIHSFKFLQRHHGV